MSRHTIDYQIVRYMPSTTKSDNSDKLLPTFI